jgi:hypothetical protein
VKNQSKKGTFPFSFWNLGKKNGAEWAPTQEMKLTPRTEKFHLDIPQFACVGASANLFLTKHCHVFDFAKKPAVFQDMLLLD